MKVIVNFGPQWEAGITEKKAYQYLYKILRKKAIEIEMEMEKERLAQEELLKEQ